MKLNLDCIRDILFEVEEKPLTYPLLVENTASRLDVYDSATILYHIDQCIMNEYFNKPKRYKGPSYQLRDLSPKGHQFLSTIRDDSNWNKTKEIAKSVGSTSLSAIAQIATGVISSVIQKTFGL